MRIKLLGSKSSDFSTVRYHRDKVDYESGELVLLKNFPEDITQSQDPRLIREHLQRISKRSRSKQPQFHVAITCLFQKYTKEELSAVAQALMEEHGYGKQPYVIIFHKDTEHNHVHVVSTRISVESGFKIVTPYEFLTIKQSFCHAFERVHNIDYTAQAKMYFNYQYSSIDDLRTLLEANAFRLFFSTRNQDFVVARNNARVFRFKEDQLVFRDKLNLNRLREIELLFEREGSKASAFVFGAAETRMHFHKATSESPKKPLSNAVIFYVSELQYRMKKLHDLDLLLKMDSTGTLQGTLIDHQSQSVFGPKHSRELLKQLTWTGTFLELNKFISLCAFNIKDQNEKDLLKLMYPELRLKDYMLFENLEKQGTRSRSEIKSDVAFFINNPLKQGVRILKNPTDQIYYAAHERYHHLEPLQTLVGPQLFQKYLSMQQKIEAQVQTRDSSLESTLTPEKAGSVQSIMDVLEDLLVPTYVSPFDREEQNRKRKKKIR